MEDRLPRVHRVVAVIDCGIAVNPRMIAGQIESAVNYGLSAALDGSRRQVHGLMISPRSIRGCRGSTFPVASLAHGDLLPVDGDVARSLDTDTHLRAVDGHHRHLDIIADPKSFAGAARQN
jgi:Molybdopterin-binding domain of aldehyde dehydrogenase